MEENYEVRLVFCSIILNSASNSDFSSREFIKKIMQERDLDLNKEEKLKHELRNTLEKAYPGLDFSINGLKLKLKGFYPNSTTYSLEIDTHLSERVDVINLTNMPIKQSTIKQLKEDQKKHGYKELTTMIADVLEKHYEKD